MQQWLNLKFLTKRYNVELLESAQSTRKPVQASRSLEQAPCKETNLLNLRVASASFVGNTEY